MSKRRKARPDVIVRCVAAQYQGPTERIVEFSDGQSGGLISFRRHPPTGRLIVQVYNQDPDVEVLVSSFDPGAELNVKETEK